MRRKTEEEDKVGKEEEEKDEKKVEEPNVSPVNCFLPGGRTERK